MSRLLKLKGDIEWHRAVSIDPLVLADEDLDYIIQQAERAEVLGEVIDEIKRDEAELQSKYKTLYQENKRYKQALEGIVNIDGYFIGIDMPFDSKRAYELIDEIARKALEESQ